MNRSTFDVVVVGAGIVGAACAEACSRGGLRVAVLDREDVGGGATAAGMGHIVAMDDSEAQFALTRYSQQLWQTMAPELPADVEYQASGTVWVAADEEEMAEVRRKHEYYARHGVPSEILDENGIRDAEPNLRHGLAGGLLVPDDAVMYPPCAARFLLKKAQGLGAQVFVRTAAVALGKGKVRCANGAEFCAAHIVNATGAWAPDLLPDLPVKRRKGHLVITDRYPGYVRHQLVELGYLKSAHSVSSDSVAFNVQPRRTGQLLIGSSRQYGNESSQVDDAMLKRMLLRAEEYMPELKTLSAIRTWTGFRAATPDKLPLIGPVESDLTLTLATGHEGLGITTSLATGHLVAAWLTGGKAGIPAEPYLPGRTQEAGHA